MIKLYDVELALRGSRISKLSMHSGNCSVFQRISIRRFKKIPNSYRVISYFFARSNSQLCRHFLQIL